jgi:hypothetical protein
VLKCNRKISGVAEKRDDLERSSNHSALNFIPEFSNAGFLKIKNGARNGLSSLALFATASDPVFLPHSTLVRN